MYNKLSIKFKKIHSYKNRKITVTSLQKIEEGNGINEVKKSYKTIFMSAFI